MGDGAWAESDRSRRLPPPEAWNHPDKWLDLSTGFAKTDIKRIALPPDENGLVKIHEAVEEVKSLFCDDFEWPFDVHDPETAPDDHHFYFTEEEYDPAYHGGSKIPYQFRNLPVNVGRMPRQFHNVIHDLTAKSTMPPYEVMADQVATHQFAVRSLKQLVESAKGVTANRALFPLRRQSVASGRVRPSDGQDSIGEAILRKRFAKEFAKYSNAIDMYWDPDGMRWDTESLPPIYAEVLVTVNKRPDIVLRRLGSLANMSHLNLIPIIAAA